jgi:hypothetical protein
MFRVFYMNHPDSACGEPHSYLETAWLDKKEHSQAFSSPAYLAV